jgi:hypothetical protein
MPSIGETGFTSKEQEKYLMKNEPALYKRIVKKHGHYGKAKNFNNQKKENPLDTKIRGQ